MRARPLSPLCVDAAEYLRRHLAGWWYSVKMPAAGLAAATSYLASKEAAHTDDAEDVEDS